MSTIKILAASVAFAFSAAACSGPVSSTAALKDALASAGAGDTIEIADGDYSGPLEVPAGVVLRAEHSGEVTIGSTGDGTAVTVHTADGATTELSGIALHPGGTVGLLVKGDGSFRGSQLTLRCARGIGVAAEGPAVVELTDVTISSTTAAAQLAQQAYPLDGAEHPIVGLALSRVADAQLENVSISGFGGYGALLVDTSGSWSGGSLSDNVGVAMMIDGGDFTLADLVVENVLRALSGTDAIVAFGLVLAGVETSVASARLKVDGSEDFGVFQDRASSQHSDLELLNNGAMGFRLQHAGADDRPALTIDGASRIEDNGGGGIFARGCHGITIRDAAINGSVERLIPLGSGTVAMADGIQLVDQLGDLALHDIVLQDNARIGLLIDGASDAAMTVQGVQISGSGDFGLVAQNGAAVAPEWTVQKDAKFEAADANAGTLGTAPALSSYPGADKLRQHGLVGPQGLIDGAGTLDARVGGRGIDTGGDG